MRGFCAVFGRELTRSKNLFIAFLAAALLEFPLALLLRGWGFSEALSLLAAIFSAAFGIGTAVILGATFLAPDLSRAGTAFDFERPVSGGALFFGRLGAGLTVTTAAALLPLLPGLVAGERTLWESLSNPFRAWDPSAALLPGSVAALALLGLVLLFLLSQAVSSMVRDRSPWILVDLALGSVLAVASSVVLYGFLVLGMESLFFCSLSALTAALALGILGGGWAQCSRGRLDAHVGHRALSAALWGTMTLATLGLWGLQEWARHPTFSQATGTLYPETSPSGRRYTLATTVKGRGPETLALFLGETGGGTPRLVDIGAAGNYVHFSPDERWALWTAYFAFPTPEFRIKRLALHSNGGPEDTGLRLENGWPLFFFSADSKTLALMTEYEAPLLSFPSLDQLASVRLPRASESHRFSGGRFLKDGSLLLLSQSNAPEREPSEVRLWRWEPSGPRMVLQAAIPTAVPWWVRLSPDGERLLAPTAKPPHFGLSLYDAATGELLGFPSAGRDSKWAVFLQDGRFVLVEEGGGRPEAVVLCSRDGQVLHRLEAEGNTRFLPIGEILPGHMAFNVMPQRGRFEERRLAVYDVAADA